MGLPCMVGEFAIHYLEQYPNPWTALSKDNKLPLFEHFTRPLPFMGVRSTIGQYEKKSKNEVIFVSF